MFVAGARAADELDPSFGSGGVVTPILPQEGSQALAGIVDLAAAPDPAGSSVAALKGLASSGYFGAVRLTAAGAPDPSFGQGGFTLPLVPDRAGINLEAQAEAVAVQGDGKVVVAGYLQHGIRRPTSFQPLLVRCQANGSLDPDFGTGGVVVPQGAFGQMDTLLHGVDIAPDGRIIAVAGRGEDRPSASRAAGIVFAYNPDGSLDKTFGRGGGVFFSQQKSRTHTSLRDVEVLGNGKILAAGYRSRHPFLVRLRADGSPDRRFGRGDGMTELRKIDTGVCCPTAALALHGDGRIVIALNKSPLRRERVTLIRFRPNGTIDPSFGKRGTEHLSGPWRLNEARDVVAQGNGGILTVGRGEPSKRNPTAYAYSVFRSRPDGRPDRSFGNHGLLTLRYGGESLAGAALAQPDGGVLTGGSFATVDGIRDRYVTTLLLARLLGQ